MKLVYSICIISSVVRQLDARKREMISARDAIRFLETLLESGDKFIRVQRPFEFQSIKSLVGCPKRNDKEAWFVFYKSK